MSAPVSNIQPWRGGRCEAGVDAIGPFNITSLPPCSKRARWMVNGVLLCGGCKRKLLGKTVGVSRS